MHAVSFIQTFPRNIDHGLCFIFDFTFSVNTPPSINCSNSTFVAEHSKDYVVIILGNPGWTDDTDGVRQVIILMHLPAKY